MKLHNYIDDSHVLLNIHVDSKEMLIEYLASVITKECHETVSLSKQDIITELTLRDTDMSTGIGNGIAIPHIRSASVKSLEIVIGTTLHPIEYGSIDHVPIDLFACLLIPEVESTKGLKAMALLMRFFLGHAQSIRAMKTSHDLIEQIYSLDLALEEPIFAQDIMVPVPFIATKESSLKEITLNMSRFHMLSVPVVDEDNKLVGEITSANLLNIGIPDFFKSLRTVSFVSYFDPFEEYFRRESGCTAVDVMVPIADPMSTDKTMLEIVFALAIKNRPALFIVDQERLVGMIDQATVMHRVINY